MVGAEGRVVAESDTGTGAGVEIAFGVVHVDEWFDSGVNGAGWGVPFNVPVASADWRGVATEFEATDNGDRGAKPDADSDC